MSDERDPFDFLTNRFEPKEKIVKHPDQRVYILEGPDGTGKTEVGKALSEYLNIPYFRMASQHENWRNGQFLTALRFDQTYLVSFLEQTGTSVIIDRAYPSEFVYSGVYERETDPDLLGRIDEQFANLGTVIVNLLKYDYEGSRPDEVVKPDELVKLHEMYKAFQRWTACDVIEMYVDSFRCNLQYEFNPLLFAIQDMYKIQKSRPVGDYKNIIRLGTHESMKRP